MTSVYKSRKQLRSIGHKLQPVVIVSKGLGATVLAEIDRALNDHELIKVRVNAADRDEKKALIATICAQSGAELVQSAGHIALLLRTNPKPDPKLSNLLRHKELLG